MWNKWRLNYSEFPNIVPSDVKGINFAEGKEPGKNLTSLLSKELESLDDHGCPKVQDLVDQGTWICSSYPLTRKSAFHCADRKKNFSVTG